MHACTIAMSNTAHLVSTHIITVTYKLLDSIQHHNMLNYDKGNVISHYNLSKLNYK